MRDFIGVLGGMGPMATADFMKKIILKKSSSCDQEHVPLLVYSHPSIPDRSSYILNQGKSPLAEMVAGALKLESCGASCIVIPCNTAHFWYDDLSRITKTPILNIVDCVAKQLVRHKLNGKKVMILGTDGTRASRIYESRLESYGYTVIFPSDEIQQKYIMPTIKSVKEGQNKIAENLFESAITEILKTDISAIILACTELPVIYKETKINNTTIIDSTEALAIGALNWAELNLEKNT